MKRVALLAFENMSPFHLSVPCVVFGDVSKDFALTVCAETDAPLSTTAGFHLSTTHDLRAFDDADIIIIPSWHSPYQPPSDLLINALQKAHRKGTMIIGLCLGAYAIAAAGILDGKKATTHWAYFEDFKARFPLIDIESDVLYLQQDNVMTSAGTAAGLDCCLHVVRQTLGSTASNNIARYLVTPPQRLGGQAQYIATPIPEKGSDKRLATVLDEVLQSLDQPHSIEQLAERCAMSRRTFTRHFQAVTGKSFGQWLLSARLSHSQQLLETSTFSIEHVAAQSGFNTPTTLRHHFKRAFGISPSVWRKMYV
ncbi:GlxA family transcriptional regulator [Enterovibrio coralii]|uniref:AraC family transcriptional regulator n=1 Tax=Enterovibrio coralii TaxID=294935 RepID=A0A135I5X3_9GAMM|nr:helix-turn-helix domain-containing protein [Enterovibrio coralii]KXF80807.1 AraC family transcriptional regulator [Enterovibrio coralii]